jgi:hypothetical protein
MNRRIRSLICVVLLACSGISSMAFAEPSCSVWMKQSDGSYWRTCVGDDGRQYCESATDAHGSNATRVSCNG